MLPHLTSFLSKPDTAKYGTAPIPDQLFKGWGASIHRVAEKEGVLGTQMAEGPEKGRGVENPGGKTGWALWEGGKNLASLLL